MSNATWSSHLSATCRSITCVILRNFLYRLLFGWEIMQSYSDILFYSLMLKEPNYCVLRPFNLLPSDVGREHYRFSNPKVYILKNYSPPCSFSVFFSLAVSRSSTFDFPEPIAVNPYPSNIVLNVWQNRRAKQFNSLLNIN